MLKKKLAIGIAILTLNSLVPLWASEFFDNPHSLLPQLSCPEGYEAIFEGNIYACKMFPVVDLDGDDIPDQIYDDFPDMPESLKKIRVKYPNAHYSDNIGIMRKKFGVGGPSGDTSIIPQ